MATDIADLGLEVDSEGFTRATKRMRSYQKAAGDAETATEKMIRRMDRMGQSMERMGRTMTLRVTAPIAAFAGAGVAAFGNFDAAMTQSLAIMGDVSDEMRGNMARAARDVAKVTEVSAKEAAESYFFLASAGLDAQQSIAALPQVAKFAQAGSFDMARATDLATDAQSALGLAADDAQENLQNLTRVTDVLVGANTLANASVEQFAEALTNRAAAAMRDLNIEMETGVAVLAAWADQGVKGRRAGEQFNIVTRDLQRIARDNAEMLERMNIAVFDSQGTFRNMSQIVGDLEQALEGMSTKQRGATLSMLGFQDESVQAIRSLLGFSEAMERYERGMVGMAGITDEVANKQLETFWKQLGLTKDQITDVFITIGEGLVPALQDLNENTDSIIATAERWAEAFRDADTSTKIAIASTVGLVAALGPLLIIGGIVANSIAGIGKALLAMRAASIGAKGAVASMIALEKALGATSTSSALLGQGIKRLTPLLGKAGLLGVAALVVIETRKFNEQLAEGIDISDDFLDSMARISEEFDKDPSDRLMSQINRGLRGMREEAERLEDVLARLNMARQTASPIAERTGQTPPGQTAEQQQAQQNLDDVQFLIRTGEHAAGIQQHEDIANAIEMVGAVIDFVNPKLQALGEMFTKSGDQAEEAADEVEKVSNHNAEFETMLDRLAASLGGEVAEAQQEYNERLAETDALLNKGEISATQAARAKMLYQKALEDSIDVSDDFNAELDRMEAALDGPVAEAALEYSEQIREYLQLLEDGRIDQEDFNRGIDIARRTFETSRRPTERAVDNFYEMEAALELAAAKAGMTAEEVEHLEQELHVMETVQGLVNAAQEAGIEVTDEMILRYRELAIAGMEAAESQNTFADSLGRSLAQAMSLGQGGSLFDSIGAAFQQSGAEVIQGGLQDAFEDVFSSEMFASMGLDETQVGAFAYALGTIIADQTGEAIGQALGTAIGSIWGPVGAAIGSIIGGLIGGAFDSVPKFQVRGTEATRAIDEGTDFTRETELGTIEFAFRGIEAEVKRQVEQAFLDFDQSIASFIRDQDQLDAIEQALAEWGVSSRSDGEDIEGLLQSRFDAILSTFDEGIRNAVQMGVTLEEQVQRLADVMSITNEVGMGRGLGLESVEATVTAIADLAIPNEALAAAFVRIRESVENLDTALALAGTTMNRTRLETVQFAAELSEAFGDPQRAAEVWDTVFSTFYDAGERAAVEADQARQVATALLDQLGIEMTDELQTREGFRELLEELMPELGPEDLAILLEAGESIANLIDAEERLADARGNSLTDLEAFEESIREQTYRIINPLRLEYEQLAETQAEAWETANELNAGEDLLMRTRMLHNLQMMQFTATLEDTLRSLNEQFTGGNDPAQQFQNVGNAVDDTARQVRESFIRALEAVDAWLEQSQLSNLSPLTPQDRLAEAQAQFDQAFADAMAGDLEALQALPGLADALLGEGADFFGTTTSDFQALWDQVQAAMGQASELEPPPEPPDPPTAAQQQSIVNNTEDSALSGWERLQAAMQMIDIIGMLSEMTGEAPAAIGEEFGINIADLIATLTGEVPDLTGDALSTYFDDMVFEQAAAAEELAEMETVLGDSRELQSQLVDRAVEQVSLLDEMRGYLQMIANETQEFDTGGPVRNTGFARVHAGEFVIPRNGVAVSQDPATTAAIESLRAEVQRLAAIAERGNAQRGEHIRVTADSGRVVSTKISELTREERQKRVSPRQAERLKD